jgi:hypothetical protein
MSGVPDFNFPTFFAAAGTLQRLGHETVNPADNDGPTLESALRGAHANVAAAGGEGKSWASYLKRDLPRLIPCDAVCVLPGWQRSRGANLEVDVATRLGMPIYCLQWLEKPYLVPRVRAIGVAGYARAGKDTVGEVLVGQGYRRASFAARLKELARTVDPVVSAVRSVVIAGEIAQARISDVVDVYGWETAKDKFAEVRPFLQRLGTGVRDLIGADVWVDLAFKAIPDGARVVFTDVRFPNEAEAIRNLGGQVWRVTRPNVGPANGHASETALDDYEFDVTIRNDGDLSQLSGDVLDALDLAKLAGASL